MRLLIPTVALLGMFLVGTPAGFALASEKAPAYNHEQFKMCDKNKDDHLSKEEFLACWPGQEDKFTKMDTNNDGKLTTEEMRIGWPDLHHKEYPDGAR